MRGFYKMRALAGALLLACSLPGCSFWQKENVQSNVELDGPKMHYYSVFPDLEDEALTRTVKDNSLLRRMKERPPLTRFALEKRVQRDVIDICETLEGEGYFDRKVVYHIVEITKNDWEKHTGNENTEEENEEEALYEKNAPKPPHDTSKEVHTSLQGPDRYFEVTFTITPGTRYTVRSLETYYMHVKPLENLDVHGLHLKVKKGDFVNLKRAKNIAEDIARYWRNRGYPFAEAKRMRGVQHPESKTMDIILSIDTGEKALFGPTLIKGLTHLSERYVRNRLAYKEGDVFNEEEVNTSRKTLLETGLFNDVSLSPKPNLSPITPSQSDNDAADTSRPSSLPFALDLKEGPPRTVGAGAKFATSEGFGAHAFWRHDNFLGSAESLKFKALLGKKKNELSTAFQKPDVFLRNHTFLSEVTLFDDVTPAYKSTTGEINAGFRYKAPYGISFGYGAFYEASRVKRLTMHQKTQYWGVPLTLGVDQTHSLLNPSSGFKLHVKTTPYVSLHSNAPHFSKYTLFGSVYLRPICHALERKDNAFVLAFWGRYGAITTSRLSAISLNKRFYAGGSESVRGYGYQRLGPIDSNAKPTGGLSRLEIGGEARFALTEKLGGVLFLEAGEVSLSNTPAFKSKDILWGPGVGVRYYTDIGPLRFDIACPGKRRTDPGSTRNKKIDSPLQFYITIGQAF